MQIRFADVPVGHFFISKQTKRCFGGIKIMPIQNGDGIVVNAVILTDHVDKKAYDCGAGIQFPEHVLVEIDEAIISVILSQTQNGGCFVGLHFNKQEDSLIKDMMHRSSLLNFKDLLDNALSFFAWGQHKTEEGKCVASFDEKEGVYTEAILPAFQNIKNKR